MRRTPILALATGALTVSMTVIAPNALASAPPLAATHAASGTTNTSAELAYTATTEQPQNLGTVNLAAAAAAAGATPSAPTGTTSHGHPAATPLGRPPAASGTGKGKPPFTPSCQRLRASPAAGRSTTRPLP